MNFSKELIKGSTATLILSVLEHNDMYGYKIVKEIDKRSEGAFCLKEGSLYPTLHSLEENELVVSYWEVFDNRNRKYYQITKKGRKELNSKKKEWKEYSKSVNKVLNLA
ncbi:MAG: PadR family transcriptional regulator [Clostridium sp.]|nr:PadR family transcriptional regulator [Clostridium sp.]